jgi:hypothetical protein
VTFSAWSRRCRGAGATGSFRLKRLGQLRKGQPQLLVCGDQRASAATKSFGSIDCSG